MPTAQKIFFLFDADHHRAYPFLSVCTVLHIIYSYNPGLPPPPSHCVDRAEFDCESRRRGGNDW